MARNSEKADTPKKTRWYKQLWQVFQMTRRQDPLIALWLAICFFGIVIIAFLVGTFLWKGHSVYVTILGVPVGILVAMIVLTNRAQWAAYKQIDGQEGASYAALNQIRRGWTFEEEPVAIDPRTHEMIFRGVGRPGVVLVGEGRHNHLTKLFDAEKRKISRVVPNVPLTIVECGHEDGQVPLRKLARKVQRLRPKLTKSEVDQVTKRLQSMGGLRMPVPKGIDPLRARPNRKALRG